MPHIQARIKYATCSGMDIILVVERVAEQSPAVSYVPGGLIEITECAPQEVNVPQGNSN
jgi:hypothetical protein